jgi:hypothetical protein
MPEGHTDPRAARPASGEALRTIAELVEQRDDVRHGIARRHP